MIYLLDTNICIYIIKKRPSEVFERFNNLRPGDVGISTITLAELQYGAEKSSYPVKNKAALAKFLIPLEIIDFDYWSAIDYGKIRSDLERKGTPIGPLDLLIAAQAVHMGVILVTNNVREFNRIDGLSIENWVSGK